MEELNSIFKGKKPETIQRIKAINEAAKAARCICTDIIRQTSLKPYYGKIGAAAFYAPEDESERQCKAVAEVLQHLIAANEALVDIGINGGLTEEQLRLIRRTDDDYGKGQIIE